MDPNILTQTPAGPPPTVAMAMAPMTDTVAAARYTWKLAHEHYENFTVVSWLVPKALRQDFCNIYAFCRTADDLGDEVADRTTALKYLDDFRSQTVACYAGDTRTAIFTALRGTIDRHKIPIQPFLDLIDAFVQDQRVQRYETFDQVLDYCRRSADPVGRLVLYLGGYSDPERQSYSDKICSALQLANFWQDVRSDILRRNRIYIPAESMARFGVTQEQIIAGRCDQNYRNLLHFEVDRAADMFRQGRPLLPLIRASMRTQISLFSRGGLAILESIRRLNYDTLTTRPRLSQTQKLGLMGRAVMAMAIKTVMPGGRK